MESCLTVVVLSQSRATDDNSVISGNGSETERQCTPKQQNCLKLHSWSFICRVTYTRNVWADMCSTFYALMTPLCAKHVTSGEKHVIRANAAVRSTNVLGEGLVQHHVSSCLWRSFARQTTNSTCCRTCWMKKHNSAVIDDVCAWSY